MFLEQNNRAILEQKLQRVRVSECLGAGIAGLVQTCACLHAAGNQLHSWRRVVTTQFTMGANTVQEDFQTGIMYQLNECFFNFHTLDFYTEQVSVLF